MTAPFEYPSAEVIEDPFPFYAWLRAEAPVHVLPNGHYLVSRWEDVVHVVRHPEVFSSLIGPLNDQILGGPRVGGDEHGPWPISFADPPAHRHQRALSASMVARERVRALEPVVRRLVDGLIDGFIDRGEAEFRSEFAALLPRRVVMEFFGFPAKDEPRFVEWARGQGPVGGLLASDEERAAEQERRQQLAAYFEAAILERRKRPTDDYVSVFVHDHVERDGGLDMPYVLTELTNLFAAGNVTTAHMLASMMLLLLTNPAELERVRADHALIRPALEEALRLECPVQWNQRVAKVDTELAGVAIPRGSLVLIAWAAANRDERKFDDPDRFWIERPNLAKQHLAFGQGIHMCIGAPLARLEGQIAFERLLSRLRDLRLAEGKNDFTHIEAINQRSPREVHIAFEPARA